MAAPASHPHLGLLLPLCTSSATIGLALFQYPIFYSFLPQAQHQHQHQHRHDLHLARPAGISGRPLSRFWKAFMPGALAVIVGSIATSALSGTLAYRWLQHHGHLETSAVAQWYLWGAALAASHLAFVPLVVPPLQQIGAGANDRPDHGDRDHDLDKLALAAETELERANQAAMKTWFLWHTVRTLTVDFGAVWCFAKGVELALWVV